MGMPKYNPTKVGAVIVFRDGTTEKQATDALKKLKDVLDYQPRIQSFDPNYGGPVWYVP
jgi:hypothetical protein